VIELHLSGKPELRLSRVEKRPRKRRAFKRSRQASADLRRHWKELRAFRKRHEELPNTVSLVWNDAELRALVALRCAQQGYRADVALAELREYALGLGVPDQSIDDVLTRVMQGLVAFSTPGGLPRYIRLVKRAVLAEEADESAGVKEFDEERFEVERGDERDGQSDHRVRRKRLAIGIKGSEPLRVSQAARFLGVSRRTVYYWIETGKLTAAGGKSSSLRIEREEIERVGKLTQLRPGDLYNFVMDHRERGYDAARMWVRRRRLKGLSDRQILEEARGSSRG
jgi:excisionase family DNA binding protein